METNKVDVTSKRKLHFTNKHREWLTGYAFISLWLIGLIIFTLWPIFQAFYYSFCEAKYYSGSIISTFNWFNNFKYAFVSDAKFPSMLASYAIEVVIQTPFIITIALLIAMMLNQKIKFRGFWRVIFFLPVIIISGPVVSELMNQGATSIQALESGTVQEFITNYLPKLLSNVITMLFSKLIIVLWYTGIPILIFLAGLQKLNRQVYEAASIDGASSWESFWKITLPSMSPFILVNAIYVIVTLSSSTLASSENESIIEYIRKEMVDGRGLGYACALGIIYLLAILLQIGIYALIVLPKKRKKRG